MQLLCGICCIACRLWACTEFRMMVPIGVVHAAPFTRISTSFAYGVCTGKLLAIVLVWSALVLAAMSA